MILILDYQAITADVISCEASSEFDSTFSCIRAFDGRLVSPGWAANGQQEPIIGAWIKAIFQEPSVISRIIIVQRPSLNEQTKQVKITAEDGTSEIALLPNQGQSEPNHVILKKPMLTSSIKIEITAAYTEINNGFNEIYFIVQV